MNSVLVELFGKFFCVIPWLTVLISGCIADTTYYNYNDTGYRVLFLGGYHDNTAGSNEDDMCFTYKLHQHVNKAGLYKPSDDESVVFSINFCDLDNSNGHTLSDYLKSVTMVEHGLNDNYYVDDSTFYYSSSDENVDPVVDLCFQSLPDSKDVKIVTKTSYCIEHVSKANEKLGDKLCLDRGVYVTDVCGLPSLARFNIDEPPASIAYVPKPGQTIKLS